MSRISVAIIDCGAGNLHSVRKAVAHELPAESHLNIVTEAAALKEASHIILPGVGAFADCMKGFHALPGMRDALENAVMGEKKPFLGICVGMQMLFQRGHEHGVHAGFGWFKGEVEMLVPGDASLRIPHMGWNRLRLRRSSPILSGVHDGDYVYFVHSYAATHCEENEVLAITEYGGDVVALIGRDNIAATQFHPEKSQAVGLRILRNFLGS